MFILLLLLLLVYIINFIVVFVVIVAYSCRSVGRRREGKDNRAILRTE
jgi:hypothetical protein